MVELPSKVGNAAFLKVEVVHVDVETLPVLNVEMLLRVLEQEGGLSNTACALDAYQAVVPVDFIHQDSTNRGVRMLNQIAMCTKECFH